MGQVVRLQDWKRDRESPRERLVDALYRLEELIHSIPDDQRPEWMATELAALLGYVEGGWVDHAARRAEELLARCEKESRGA